MDVTVESSATLAGPLGQSYPTSPSGSRKRSFHQLDDVGNIKIIEGSNRVRSQENQAPQDFTPPSIEKVETPAKQSLGITTSEASMTTGSKRTTLADAMDDVTHASSLSTPNLTTSPPSVAPQLGLAQGPIATANKKRKLSPVSKEVMRLEKEEKDRVKLEEKAKKEEEKRIKEEERKKREVERDEEKRKREEKKRAKEEERIAKEEEKRKKEAEKKKKESVSEQPGTTNDCMLTSSYSLK
jgi:chromatin assembly factor 1 subunit A